MKVGTIVKLKVNCLSNRAGTLGVVFYDYGNGFQAIFPNGLYDGFSTVNKMPSGEIEADYILEEVGFEQSLANYQFKNVLQVEQDYRNGMFTVAFNWKAKK